MKTTFFPVEDRLVIEPIREELTTPSGLVLPEGVSQKSQKGKIVAVGPGRISSDGNLRIKPTVHIGDTVLYPRHTGFEVDFDGNVAVVLRESDILSVTVTSTEG